jgi:hypothetical protein
MDPRALLRPIGPQPGYVYWGRRLMLIAVLLFAVALADRGCASGPTPHPRALSTTSTTVPAIRATTTTTTTPCARSALSVTASTDAASYPAGVEPRLGVSVRNSSGQPCRFDASPGRRIWQVTSGTDVVWTTAQCHPGGRVHYRLRPNAAIAYSTVWNQQRSVGGCGETGTQAQPGTYVLQVTVDGVTSPAAVFHLTG